ncbi:hypothetical protein KY290_031950 [Solanum tuberosum]|uniref:MULE transposase domain-containing protein n=1 Tax=Solanum tuberosum TaxID=4113 RepID=A0ABQ7UCF6_SOLTU|nr:hypothetical protein KY290_031950 [Solanum tuberosum]
MLEEWCSCQGNGLRDNGEWIFMLTVFFLHVRDIDDTHLHGKYEGVLLSVIAQDMENRVYPIALCVVDKKNDASWTFFFEKLKEIVVDESDLCFISDRHKSIANGIVNVYNHAHHRYCMRYLEFKNKCPAAAVVLEHDIGFEKWSRTHFPGNRYDVMTTNIAESLNVMERHAYILKSMGNQMVPAAEKIARNFFIDGDTLYVENVIGDDNQLPCSVWVLLPMWTYWKSHVHVGNMT